MKENIKQQKQKFNEALNNFGLIRDLGDFDWFLASYISNGNNEEEVIEITRSLIERFNKASIALERISKLITLGE